MTQLYRYGLYRYGLDSLYLCWDCLCSYGLYGDVSYRYGLYGYGRYDPDCERLNQPTIGCPRGMVCTRAGARLLSLPPIMAGHTHTGHFRPPPHRWANAKGMFYRVYNSVAAEPFGVWLGCSNVQYVTLLERDHHGDLRAVPDNVPAQGTQLHSEWTPIFRR